jgi:hypothetical protein
MKNENLIHVKLSDDDSNIITIWNPLNSKTKDEVLIYRE